LLRKKNCICHQLGVSISTDKRYSDSFIGRPFVKRFTLCLSLCAVGVLCPNGWMDQDETCHGHTVRWERSSPFCKGAQHPPNFWPICCGQMAGWIKLPFGTEVSLCPRDIVLHGDSAPPKRGHTPNFRPMSVVAKWLDGSRCHLVRR